jgi:hypothetical protein
MEILELLVIVSYPYFLLFTNVLFHLAFTCLLVSESRIARRFCNLLDVITEKRVSSVYSGGKLFFPHLPTFDGTMEILSCPRWYGELFYAQ